jgi:hypothetical protein
MGILRPPAVPKTVVVGHGIKSLAWPSLALTVATTLFALTALWVLYIMWIGWRHARQTASQPALNLTSLAIIYSFLGALIITAYTVVSPALQGWSQADTPSSTIVFYIERNLAFMAVPPAILVVLLCPVTAVFAVARGVRYMRRLIASRAFPSMSLRGFIFRGLLLVWLSFSFLYSLFLLEIMVGHTKFMEELLFTDATAGFLILLSLLLAFVAMLLLILSGSRYIGVMIKEARETRLFLLPPRRSHPWADREGSIYVRLLRRCCIL